MADPAHPLSDIFPDSYSPEPSSSSSSSSKPGLHSPLSSEISEIPSLRAQHHTAGYRSGISASKSSWLQPGFDEGYPLGAALGLRAGYVLGVLEGMCLALELEQEGTSGDDSGSGRGARQTRTQTQTQNKNKNSGGNKKMQDLLGEATKELDVESVFAKEWWGEEDGGWKFEVEGEGGEVTFEQVAEWHPVVRKWMGRAREEMKRGGLVEGRFEGEEWEGGRID